MKGRLRIVMKDDRDSAIGRGGYLLPEHFAPRMAQLVHATAESVEALFPTARVLRITEGWRPQRSPNKRDAHATLDALDFTIEFTGSQRATFEEYTEVVARARAIVGDANYDFLVHGEAANLHIHGEYDPHQ